MPQTTETGEIRPTVPAEQFFAVDIRSAVVTAVEPFPEARHPAYKLRLDLGPLVVCVVNFPPRRIAGFKSEVLVLGVYDPEGTVVLLRPDRPVPPGHRVG
jgi:tRNA-binding protein